MALLTFYGIQGLGLLGLLSPRNVHDVSQAAPGVGAALFGG
jgi:hypothetical protein